MVLGANVSTRDHVYGWEAIQPRYRSPKETAYYQALDHSQNMEREFVLHVDAWIANGQYAEMNAFWAECEKADQDCHRLYLEWMEG
jgi:hypothetical protein